MIFSVTFHDVNWHQRLLLNSERNCYSEKANTGYFEREREKDKKNEWFFQKISQSDVRPLVEIQLELNLVGMKCICIDCDYAMILILLPIALCTKQIKYLHLSKLNGKAKVARKKISFIPHFMDHLEFSIFRYNQVAFRISL